MTERLLPDSIIAIYQGNLQTIKSKVAMSVNPQNTPIDLVRSMLTTEMVIQKKRTELTADEQLALLDQLEAWYTDQGVSFPNLDYLATQRAKLGKK